MYPTYRQPLSNPGPYPENLCRTMWPQVANYRRIIGHHFKMRHKGHRNACKSWIAGFRRDLSACGWSACAHAVNAR